MNEISLFFSQSNHVSATVDVDISRLFIPAPASKKRAKHTTNPMETRLTWSVAIFADCYNAIKYQGSAFDQLKPALGLDIRAVLTVPPRNDKSRQALTLGAEGKLVTFPNGEEFKINRSFVETVNLLATELDMDELCVAEMLQEASESTFAKGLDLADAGLLAFFLRYEFILNIVGFLIQTRNTTAFFGENASSVVLDLLLAGYTKLYALLRMQNDLIDKQKATGDLNDLQFVCKTKFVRSRVFQLHELVSSLLYLLVDTHFAKLGTTAVFLTLLNHINAAVPSDADVFIMHYLPTLLRLVSSLLEMEDAEVEKFHLQFAASVSADIAAVADRNDTIDFSKSKLRPYLLVVKLFYFINFIPWCKGDSKRTAKYDFQKDILTHVGSLLSYGTFEQLLCYTAESAEATTSALVEESNIYDFRQLLQTRVPTLKPVQLIYPGNGDLLQLVQNRPELANIASLCDFSAYKVSSHISDDLLAPYYHTFFQTFINHAAIVLTSLRDTEEDFLLSSESRQSEERKPSSEPGSPKLQANIANDTLNFSEITARADLEKFYLSIFYTYSNRPGLCSAFWADKENSNIVGFLSWGLADNTSPLITATFCLLMGSLTFGSDASRFKIWELLQNSGSTRSKTDYSVISVDSIVKSLNYYIGALSENFEADLNHQSRMSNSRPDLLVSNLFAGNKDAKSAPLHIQLSEESVVFIAGFFLLISLVVRSSAEDLPVCNTIRLTLFAKFHPLLVQYLRFDNLVTSAKLLFADSETLPIVFNEENRTVFLNLILQLLADFAASEKDVSIKAKIWTTLDCWLSHSLNETDSSNLVTSADTTRYAGISVSQSSSLSTKSDISKLRHLFAAIPIEKGLQMNLTHTSEIVNFVSLMERLLKFSGSRKSFFDLPKLCYPSDLGLKNRKNGYVGVWPYLEFLLREVFAKSNRVTDLGSRVALQHSILRIMLASLSEIDWSTVVELTPNILKTLGLDREAFAEAINSAGTLVPLLFEEFARLHHSLAVVSFLFDDKVTSTLLLIFHTDLQTKAHSDLVRLALDVILSVLDTQAVFTRSLLPLLNSRSVEGTNTSNTISGFGTNLSTALTTISHKRLPIYYPRGLGALTNADFYEILVFHLSTFASIALLVGNKDEDVVLAALKVLRKVSQSPQFTSTGAGLGKLLQRNRLLNAFESIDESVNIKYVFAQQLELINESLEVKYSILKFLEENLLDSPDATVAHFLLGFTIKANRLELEDDGNSIVLLRFIVDLLLTSIDLMSEVSFTDGYNHRILLGPSKLASLCMEVIVKLCKNPISAPATLAYLRPHQIFSKTLSSQPKIDETTIWQEFKFDDEAREGALNDFFRSEESCETLILYVKYCDSVLRYLSLELHGVSSETTRDFYIGLLIDGSEFLNGTPRVMSYLDVLNYRSSNFDVAEARKFEVQVDFSKLFTELAKDNLHKTREPLMLHLIRSRCQMASTRVNGEADRDNYIQEVIVETNMLHRFVNKILTLTELKAAQIGTLHLWVQMIQVLSTHVMSDKRSFILSVLNVVLPKINSEHRDPDVEFTEELVSLVILLFDVYDKEGTHLDLPRLQPLLKTCISGILSPDLTPKLRSGFYVVLSRFFASSWKSEALTADLLQELRSADRKFLDIVCGDSIHSDGVPRITALVLLEGILHFLNLGRTSKGTLDALSRNNAIAHLVKSLRRTDEILKFTHTVDVGTLIGELTALKSTLYVLVRIAQSQSGASRLLHHDVFSALTMLALFSIDPELGYEFSVSGTESVVRLAIDDNGVSNRQSHVLSFPELMIPVFQLVSAILVLMGPVYKPGWVQARDLMRHFRTFVVAMVRRDAEEENQGTAAKLPPTDESRLSPSAKLVRTFSLIEAISNAEVDA